MSNYYRQSVGHGARPSATTVVVQHQQKTRCVPGPTHRRVRLNTLGPSALNKPLPPPFHPVSAPIIQPPAPITAAPAPTPPTPVQTPRPKPPVPTPTPVAATTSPAQVLGHQTPTTTGPPPPIPFASTSHVGDNSKLPLSPIQRNEVVDLVKAEVSRSMQILHDRVSIIEQRVSMLASRVEHSTELIASNELASRNARTIMFNEWQENLVASNSLFQQQLARRVDALDEQVQEMATMAMVMDGVAYDDTEESTMGDDSCSSSPTMDDEREVQLGDEQQQQSEAAGAVTTVPEGTTNDEDVTRSSTTCVPPRVPPHVHVNNGHVLVFHSGETPFDRDIPAPNSVCQRLVRNADGESTFQTCIMMNNGVWAVIQSLPVTKFLASISMSVSALAEDEKHTTD